MSSADGSNGAEAMRTLSELVSLAHFRMNAVIEALYPGPPGAASRRAVLRNIVSNGPMTVPQIAALRPVSRQYIQSVVDELKAEGLVELIHNPAHRRSKLVHPTPAGTLLVSAMEAREAPLFSAAAAAVGADFGGILAAADLLGKLNRHMDRLIEVARREETREG